MNIMDLLSLLGTSGGRPGELGPADISAPVPIPPALPSAAPAPLPTPGVAMLTQGQLPTDPAVNLATNPRLLPAAEPEKKAGLNMAALAPILTSALGAQRQQPQPAPSPGIRSGGGVQTPLFNPNEFRLPGINLKERLAGLLGRG